MTQRIRSQAKVSVRSSVTGSGALWSGFWIIWWGWLFSTRKESWVVCGFAASLVSREMGPLELTSRIDITETKEWAVSEDQLEKHQLEAPNDAESTGLMSERKPPWPQRTCISQGWLTAITNNFMQSVAKCYKNILLAHVTEQCYLWIWSLLCGVVQGIRLLPPLNPLLCNTQPAKSVSKVNRELVVRQGNSRSELGHSWLRGQWMVFLPHCPAFQHLWSCYSSLEWESYGFLYSSSASWFQGLEYVL